ncbi:MAG: SpoIID/LytB domain-containing protein, partial [Chlorobium sp.]|nr:SpoIID/LytB domain-containing protein [Chlorobium sp.]
STCGGYTESSENVFTRNPVPYLITIKDGDDPYCKISPRFQWEEVYTRDEIVTRLKNYSLLDNANYELEDIFIVNKFESGRVSELKIKVVNDKGEQKSLLLRGNEIRSILRTSDNKNILWSTMFDLSTNSNSIVLKGKGFGHGVGLCEWGAIVLSRKGWKYKDILQHYYPGTNVEKYND